MAPNAHVHFRLEVKSEPFTVFSAKKFPGLAESTVLSRVVAEQGCRVRIRRDVRMRRRDNKTGKEYEEFDDDGVYTRNSRFATPDGYTQTPMPDRPRPVSHGVSMPWVLHHGTPTSAVDTGIGLLWPSAISAASAVNTGGSAECQQRVSDTPGIWKFFHHAVPDAPVSSVSTHGTTHGATPLRLIHRTLQGTITRLHHT
jgi:hypothetical protein